MQKSVREDKRVAFSLRMSRLFAGKPKHDPKPAHEHKGHYGHPKPPKHDPKPAHEHKGHYGKPKHAKGHYGHAKPAKHEHKGHYGAFEPALWFLLVPGATDNVYVATLQSRGK